MDRLHNTGCNNNAKNGGGTLRLPDAGPSLGVPVEAGLEHIHQQGIHTLHGEADPMVGVHDGLQLHDGDLDVAEGHAAVGEVVEDAAEAPHVHPGGVLLAGEQDLRGTIPARCHVVR